MDALINSPEYNNKTRLAMLHVDDIGMCRSTVDAFSELWDNGAVTSGSVMTACPWFPEVADWYSQHKDADLGVHITLTSEWSGYRWGPVAATAIEDGLVDSSGRYFHSSREDVCRYASMEAVGREIISQIELARRAGLQPSHIDSHMHTCFQQRFIEQFLELSINQLLPVPITRYYLKQLGTRLSTKWEQQLQDAGFPVFEDLIVVKQCFNVDEYNHELEKIISGLSPGLNCILLHPAMDSNELRNITPHWRFRVVEFEALLEKKIWEYAEQSGVKIINYNYLTGQSGALTSNVLNNKSQSW